MPRGKNYGPEEIIPKLREAEVLMSQGTTQELAAKPISVATQTLIRWRKKYGGLRMDQAKRLKGLEQENTRLKRLLGTPNWIRRSSWKLRRARLLPASRLCNKPRERSL